MVQRPDRGMVEAARGERQAVRNGHQGVPESVLEDAIEHPVDIPTIMREIEIPTTEGLPVVDDPHAGIRADPSHEPLRLPSAGAEGVVV